MHRRLSLVALAAAALCGVAAPSASAALPLDTLTLGEATSPRHVVSVGRYAFFTQGTSKIGRVSEDGTVTEFPSGFTSTDRITVGPGGTLWFLGANGGTASKKIGRMEQDGTLLSQTQASKDWGTGLTTGADGNVWVAEGEWVAKYAPNGNLIDEYFVNVGNGGFAHDVTPGPDGNIWITEGTLPGKTAIGRITPTGTLITFTGFIGPSCTAGSSPVTCTNSDHLAVGPDGNLWYTTNKVYDGNRGSIGTLTTGGFAGDQELAATKLPTEISGGPDLAMYVLASDTNALLRVDLLGHVTDSTPLEGNTSGLQFGADGKCRLNPHGDGFIPTAAQLRSYPVAERNGAIWVWMGEPERADMALLPQDNFWNSPEYASQFIHITVDANYELVADNLLDLTHAPFLHARTLAGDGAERPPLPSHEFRVDGEIVHSNYHFARSPTSAVMKTLFTDPVGEFEARMTWRPACTLELDIWQRPLAGSTAQTLHLPSMHYLTPASDTVTHYFACQARNLKIDDPREDELMRSWVIKAFTEEDAPMLRACQSLMGTTDLFSLKPAILKTDAAAIQARRIVTKLLAEEQRV